MPADLILGINASRARSGGAKAHLVGILGHVEPRVHGFAAVHVWCDPSLLDALPNAPWLIKHCPERAGASMVRQLWWERFVLPGQVRQARCDLLFNVDAGTVCRFRPAVTMSRDMLSFEPGEIKRYGWGKARLRLLLLRSVQQASLRDADGAVFLTRYAGETILGYTGSLNKVAFVPHGVADDFRRPTPTSCPEPHAAGTPIRCLYVSNVAPYKHQWHVVRAVRTLRERGYDAHLTLTGGGAGGGASTAQRRLDAELADSDPGRAFTRQLGYVPHQALPGILAAADLFVFASSCENMPNTLLEAMAIGLPIACSNRGPMPEVLRDGGVYFDPEDPVSIADAMQPLCESIGLRVRLAARAKELASEYSWDRCARETFAFLAEALPRIRG